MMTVGRVSVAIEDKRKTAAAEAS